MDKNLQVFRFRIRGELISTFRNSNLDELEEKIFRYLKEFENDINYQIEEEIRYEINAEVEVKARLSFERGSVLWDGVLSITDVMSQIAGTVSLIGYIAKIIKYAIDKIIDNRLRKEFGIADYQPRTFVLNIPEPKQFRRKSPEDIKEKISNPFTLKTILLAITFLNILLFLGGTIYNSIKVDSIGEQYQEAMKIISETKNKYQETLFNLYELERNNKLIVDGKISSIELEIDSTVRFFTNSISASRHKILVMTDDIDSLKNLISKNKAELKSINNKLIKLKGLNITFSIWDVYEYSNWILDILITILIVSLPLSIIVLLFRK